MLIHPARNAQHEHELRSKQKAKAKQAGKLKAADEAAWAAEKDARDYKHVMQVFASRLLFTVLSLPCHCLSLTFSLLACFSRPSHCPVTDFP